MRDFGGPGIGLVLLLLLPSMEALAGDGVLEINQACIATGCFAGDGPGLPIEINDQGSYRLTSNLIGGNGATAIRIFADGVVLDLGGFTVGPCVNVVGICPILLVQTGILGNGASDVTVRNGVVQGFRGSGIRLFRRALVEDLVVRDNAGTGISVEEHSIVRNNRVSGNGLTGLSLGFGTAWGGNVLTGNSPDFSGDATAIAHNLCSGRRCGRVEARRYYATKSRYDGASADEACAAGYHFATFAELADPSGLQYDTVLGRSATDSGEGPTVDQGWVRSTSNASSETVNCRVWTTATQAFAGTAMRLQILLPGAATSSSPWLVELAGCEETLPVWCVED